MCAKPNSTQTILIVLGVALAFGFVLCGGGAIFLYRATQTLVGTANIPEGETYSSWRANFRTNLSSYGPAPQEYENELVPHPIQEVRYQSGGNALKAWVYVNPQTRDAKHPTLLFLHGGFAFGMGDLMSCQAAMDQDYVVMAPALRGENGNPGNFELFFGEVNDAQAAAVWLSQQPYVDPQQIYVFGHSVGGGISSVLSLLDDVPIQHSGSAGGLYPPSVFLSWSDITPFPNTPDERMARLLIGNIEHMQRKHYAYIGTQDITFESAITAAKKESDPPGHLEITRVPGDHFTSFDEALNRYLQVIASEAF